MNKAELVQSVAKQTGLTQPQTLATVNAILETILNDLENGGEVTLQKFGTFKNVTRAAHVARNPATGQNVNVPEKTKKTFKFTASVR